MSPRARAKSLARARNDDSSEPAPPIPLPHGDGAERPTISNVMVDGSRPEDASIESEGWEVLQPAGGAQALGKGLPPRKSQSPARRTQPTTPTKRRPSGGAAPAKTPSKSVSLGRSAGTKSPDVAGDGTPRPRAVTGNLGGKRGISTPASNRGTPRKASAPASSAPSKNARRRAAEVNGRPRSLSASSAAVDGPLPPWVTDPGPRLYRVNPASGDVGEPHHDDLILPAVARQLEKQRMIEEVDGAGLVTEWDREGNPTKVLRNVSGATGPRRPLAQVKGANGEDGSPRIRDESIPMSVSKPAMGSARTKHDPVGDYRDDLQDSSGSTTPSSRIALDRGQEQTGTTPPGSAGLTQRKEVWQQDASTLLSEKPAGASQGAPKQKAKDADSHGGGCCSCVVM